MTAAEAASQFTTVSGYTGADARYNTSIKTSGGSGAVTSQASPKMTTVVTGAKAVSSGSGSSGSGSGVLAQVKDPLGKVINTVIMTNGHGPAEIQSAAQSGQVKWVSTPSIKQAGGAYGYYQVLSNGVSSAGTTTNKVSGVAAPVNNTVVGPTQANISTVPTTIQADMEDMSGTVDNWGQTTSVNSNGSTSGFAMPFSTSGLESIDMSGLLNIGVFALFIMLILRLFGK